MEENLTQEQVEKLRADRAALGKASVIEPVADESWEDSIARRQLAKNATRIMRDTSLDVTTLADETPQLLSLRAQQSHEKIDKGIKVLSQFLPIGCEFGYRESSILDAREGMTKVVVGVPDDFKPDESLKEKEAIITRLIEAGEAMRKDFSIESRTAWRLAASRALALLLDKDVSTE